MSLVCGSGSSEDCVDFEALSKVNWNDPKSYPATEELILFFLLQLNKSGIEVDELFLSQHLFVDLQQSLGSRFSDHIIGPINKVKISSRGAA